MPTSILDLTVSTGARVLILRAVATTKACRKAYLHEDDAETLHDLRVSIRRLRSLLRSYRPHLRTPKLKKLLRQIDAVAKSTNAARDLDVQLEWIDAQADSFTDLEAVGIDWFQERQRKAARRYRRAARKRIKADLPSLEKRIRRALGSYEIAVDAANPAIEPTLGAEFRRLAAMLVDELLEHLDAVTSRTKYDEAHQARIAGKRLRYLMMPLKQELPETREALRQLAALQDVLGDLNDAQILGEEVALAFEDYSAERARRQFEHGMSGNGHLTEPDVAPGLIALARRQHLRKAARFDEIAAHWLHGRARARLMTGSVPGNNDGDLPQEIERKYLLHGLPPQVHGAPWKDLTQGYLPGDAIVERLRVAKGLDSIRHVRTIKLGSGVARTEVEEEMSEDLFESLWPLTEGRRVHKRRYRVPADDLVWEIDQFLDRELVLAEVELPSVIDPSVPEWLAPYVVREVTDEAAFVNANLAR